MDQEYSKKSQIPTDNALRWAWIKWELAKRKTSLSKIAKALRVPHSAVASVKRRNYPRMQRGIAKRLGIAPSAIWPERYQSRNRRVTKVAQHINSVGQNA